MEYSQQLELLLKQLEHLLKSASPQQGSHILNTVSSYLREYSPFCAEPVSSIYWIDARHIEGNDYNPNNMAPPEQRLLAHSLLTEGVTQPLVVRRKSEERYELVDGFHRHHLCQNNRVLHQRLGGYVPVVLLREYRGRAENMACISSKVMV